MCQHPLIQKLMNGIKETSLGNRTEKPHQIIIDTGQRNGIISSFKIIVYLSPNLRDTELAKILRPRLFAYRIQGSASCFQQCGLETLEITNERATFGPLLFSFEKNKAVRKLGISAETPLISREETRRESFVDPLLCHGFCNLESFKKSGIIPGIQSSLKIQARTKNSNAILFMISMMKNTIIWKPSKQSLDCMKSQTRVMIYVIQMLLPFLCQKMSDWSSKMLLQNVLFQPGSKPIGRQLKVRCFRPTIGRVGIDI